MYVHIKLKNTHHDRRFAESDFISIIIIWFAKKKRESVRFFVVVGDSSFGRLMLI